MNLLLVVVHVNNFFVKKMENKNSIDGFDFNSVFVLSSLEPNERDTATELYEDIIKVRGYQLTELETYLVVTHTKDSFFKELSSIKDRCINEGLHPIIHFEMHGNSQGIGLRSGEFIKWAELKNILTQINLACNLNLFISLAVCMGNYLMQIINPGELAPFWGIVGSFEKIKNYDLLVRYSGFYDSLLTEFNFNKAVKALYEQNPSLPTDYRFINAESTFKNVMHGYHINKFGSDTIMRERFDSVIAEEGIKFQSDNEREDFFKKFSDLAISSKEEYFEKYKKIFFLINYHPENVNRFQVNFEDVT